MRLTAIAFALLGVVIAPAAAQGPPYGPEDKIPAAEQKQLAAMIEVVRHAERVEALPLEFTGEGLAAVARVVEKPVAVEAPTGRRLGRVLTGYDWTRWSPSACMFDPAVAFRFRRGNEAAVVQVCFTCGEMALDGIDGRFGQKKILDFPERNAFLAAAKKAFPKRFDAFQEEHPDVKTKGR